MRIRSINSQVGDTVLTEAGGPSTNNIINGPLTRILESPLSSYTFFRRHHVLASADSRWCTRFQQTVRPTTVRFRVDRKDGFYVNSDRRSSVLLLPPTPEPPVSAEGPRYDNSSVSSMPCSCTRKRIITSYYCTE